MSVSSRTRTLIASVTLALVATACGGGETTAAETTVPETTVPETTTAPETTAAPDTSAAPTGPVDGMAVYEANCARCHGSDGTGGRGPSLEGNADEQPDPQAAIDQVTNGGRGMPSFGDKISAEEITASVDYLREAFPAAAS